MNRVVKIVAIAMLLAVMPLRGLAAATVGFCALGHQETGQASAAHDHGSGHEHGQTPQPATQPDCNICAEHCTSGSFVVPASADSLLVPGMTAPAVGGETFAAGFVPDHLDPPPLAL